MKLSNALHLLETCELDHAIEYDNFSRSFNLSKSGTKDGKSEELQQPATDKPLNASQVPIRNLRSFVDEDAVSRLKDTTTATIDVIQQAHVDSEAVVRKISQKIAVFARTAQPQLHGGPGGAAASLPSSPDRRSRGPDGWKVEVEKALESAHDETTQIATHAHAMAMLLESLARHYDQCNQAIEMHREVEMKSRQQQLRGNSGESFVELEDLSDLVTVLENDTKELAGVIDELQERFKEIEGLTEHVYEFQKLVSENIYEKTRDTFELLERFGKEDLAQYLEELHECQNKVKPEYFTDDGEEVAAEDHGQQHLHEYTVGIGVPLREMKSLVEYYSLFWVSYQRLLLEVERRAHFKAQMQGLIDEMTGQVSRMLTEELNVRQGFFDKVSDFLPRDLWPGLLEPPPFVEIVPNGEWQVPQIDKASLETAREVLRNETKHQKKRK